MSFSFLGALANLMPGYIQGQRQAVQDNWQDLQNYNNVQSGQQANAFTEATWQPRLDMFNNQARRSGLSLINDVMNTNVNWAWYPGQFYRGMIASQFAPQQAYQDNLMQMMAQSYYMRNPGQWFNQQRNNANNPVPTVAQITG